MGTTSMKYRISEDVHGPSSACFKRKFKAALCPKSQVLRVTLHHLGTLKKGGKKLPKNME